MIICREVEVFCPTCGVKNDDPGANCFVCGNPLPTDEGRARQAAAPAPASRRTPAGPGSRRPEPKVQLGSVGDRLLALAIDRILIVALLLIPLSFFGGSWIENGLPLKPVWSAVVGSLIAVLVIFVYHFALEKTTGTTAGKLIMGLRVVNEGDREPLAAVALRNLLRLVDGLIGYLLGFFFALFDSRNRRVGDMVGGTVVVQSPIRAGERAALLVTLGAIIAGAVWLAQFFCPQCQGELRTGLRNLLERLASAL